MVTIAVHIYVTYFIAIVIENPCSMSDHGFSLSHLLLNLPHLPNHFLHIFFFSPPLENKHVNKQTNELEKKTDRGRKEGREEKERQ